MLRVLAIGLAVASCESAPRSTLSEPSAETVARHPHSQAQAAVASDLQLAVVHGRLTDARDLASWLVTHEMIEQPGWRPYLDELRDGAQAVARADDVASAGSRLGMLAHACGGCHEAAGVTASVASEFAPEDTSSLAAQMVRHRWAAARLWEGVSGPSDRAWLAGAGVLLATPLDVAAGMHDKPNVEAVELSELLREQVTRAAALTDLDARAHLFGDMMSTCAGCHSILRPLPVAGESGALRIARSR